jgi:predicted TIM-barrel fold metal-dependent hydrolase
LDCHTHCGIHLPYQKLSREWREASVDGGVVFAPVEEVYDRHDPDFVDSDKYACSRASVHEYLLDLAQEAPVFPYFFVWNDFPSVPDGFVGIKWHRHEDEPVYQYGTPECGQFIDAICRKQLPIVLEEEFDHTLEFLRRIEGRTVVIIPHMGGLNGGYDRLKRAGVFESSQVWVDTALARRREIEDFADTYGTDRIMFGSDFPFGAPAFEKRKVERLFSGDQLSAVLSRNLMRLLR